MSTHPYARREPSPDHLQPVIVGAGPAGLTAAYQLGKAGVLATVLEADMVVCVISRTVGRVFFFFVIVYFLPCLILFLSLLYFFFYEKFYSHHLYK